LRNDELINAWNLETQGIDVLVAFPEKEKRERPNPVTS
jgi:hypothetical protein